MKDIPAFPTAQYADGVRPSGFDNGMTLRDYFAAKAMTSILSEDPDYHTKHDFIDLADFSYRVADAMMKAREA
jgi:hypothetical protein